MTAPKKKRNAAATAEQILDAAEKLFAEHGFAHVSVREISEAAAVTKSLIHHHFGAKEALWTAVKERAFGAYMDAQIDLLSSAGDDDGLLRNSIKMYFEYLEANPRLVRIISWAQVEGDSDPVGLRLIPLGAAKIRQAQAEGRFRSDVNPELTLAVFISATTNWFQAQPLYYGAMQSECSHLPASAAQLNKAYIENFLNIYFNGLLSDSARSGAAEE